MLKRVYLGGTCSEIIEWLLLTVFVFFGQQTQKDGMKDFIVCKYILVNPLVTWYSSSIIN